MMEVIRYSRFQTAIFSLTIVLGAGIVDGVLYPFLENSSPNGGRSEIVEECESVFPTRFGNPNFSTKSVNQGGLMFLLTKR